MLLERKQTSAGSPYSLVKQAGDSLLSVRTQCFAADKAGVGARAQPPRGRLQYVANLALKINTKMGGVNVKLVDNASVPKAIPVIGSRPFMVFGADVTHPTSFSADDPSIAAVTASIDRTLGRYITRVLKLVGAAARCTHAHTQTHHMPCCNESCITRPKHASLRAPKLTYLPSTHVGAPPPPPPRIPLCRATARR